MSISGDYYAKLHALNSDVMATYEKLRGLQSALDRKVSAIYHEIEKSEFDEAGGNSFAKQLKITLQHRRVVKDELIRLGPVYHMFRSEIDKVDDLYKRNARKSTEITKSLNVTMAIEDVLATLETP